MSKNKTGFRAAINAKCKECIYCDQQSGTWRQQTEGCSVTSCPLWELRPVSSVGVKADE